jgi:hypothetical protein
MLAANKLQSKQAKQRDGIECVVKRNNDKKSVECIVETMEYSFLHDFVRYCGITNIKLSFLKKLL